MSYELTPFEKNQLRRELYMKGHNIWFRLGITGAQVEDILDRVIAQKRFMLTSDGEVVGDDLSLAVDDIRADRANSHLFKHTEPVEEKTKMVPDEIQKLSPKDKLRLANAQLFSDMQRRGKAV